MQHLLERPEADALLATVGYDARALCETLREVEETHAARFDREPVDWHQRLLQRGFQEQNVLDALLAISRSADTRAYQALEFSGVRVGSFRKQLVEYARRQPVSTETPGPGAGARDRHAEPPSRPSASRRRRQRAPGQRAPEDPADNDAATPRRSSRRDTRPCEGQADRAQRVRTHPRRASVAHAHGVVQADEGLLVAVDPDRLPALHGRDRELANLGDALMRAAMRAPMLVGPHGSGRTLVARHLAAVVPAPVYLLDATEYGDEEQLRADLDTIAAEKGIAIFDDLDRITSEAAPPFLPALAQAWAHASPRVLTIVSHETRAQLEAWMPGVLETLDLIDMEDVDGEDHVRAVALAAEGVFSRHEVRPAPHMHLGEITRMVDQYVTGLAMPGRVMDILDLACARVRRTGGAELSKAVCVEVICQRTGLPADQVSGSGDRDALELESRLAETVVGHDEVLTTLASLIRRNRAGFRSGRPVATSLLLGPSGVGKTEIAKALAGALFHRDDSLLRLDMSEYSESHAVARIVGAPPGYVGHEVGGALTTPVVKQPHRVILLDEIEKAHRDVHQLLLQVFDEGRLTDGRGRTVDLRHAVIIMTSNLGAELLETTAQADTHDVLAVARAAFPVELWNRIEAPLVLRPLSVEEMHTILVRLARASSQKLHASRGIRYELSQPVVRRLVRLAGKDAALGARPLRHLLTREVEGRIAESILRGTVRAGQRLRIGLERGQLRVTVMPDPPPPPTGA